MNGNSSKTRRRYGDAGFTLVELVVVIAVLAILAGVGAVAYNGYIEYTKKGVDRATIGEVIHAIELANYDDPTLIKGGESVYISGADGSGTTSLIPAFDTALERALGDLSTVKLTYGGWKLDDNASLKDVANNILNGENVKAYWDMIEEGKATYAENIDGMWNAFSAVTKTNNWTQDNFLKAIALSTDAAKKDALIAHWTDGTTFSDLGGGDSGNAYLALEVARNYSFVSFVEKYHPEMLTGTAKEEFDNFKNTCGGWGKDRLLLTQKVTVAGEEGEKVIPFELSGIGLNDSRWKGILQDYYTNYAATDAQGYLAMMEATNTIGTTMEDPTSDDYFNELEKHLGILSAALNQGQEATTQALNFTGKFATIQIVKNADRSITCKPWPSDLDPREDGNATSAGGSGAEPEVKTPTTRITVNLDSGTLTTDVGTNEVVLKVGDTSGISASKNNKNLIIPEGYEIASVTCNSKTKDYSSGGKITADIEGGFQVGMAGSKTNPVLQIYAGTASAGASATVTVTYTLKNTSSSETKTASVTFTLYASK